MKRLFFLSSSIFILSCFAAQAQTHNENNTTNGYNSPVTKGYYSIGNNASKLPEAQRISIKEVDSKPAPKGYYAIDQNNRKEKATAVIQSPNAKQKTFEIRKGYYSIGNNAQKL